MACRESAARLALLYLVSLYTNRRSRIAVHGPICNRCKRGKRGKRKMEGNEIECKKTDSNSQLIETSLRAISTAYIYTSPRSRRRTLKRYGVTRCLSRPFVFFLRLLKTAKRAKKKKKSIVHTKRTSSSQNEDAITLFCFPLHSLKPAVSCPLIADFVSRSVHATCAACNAHVLAAIYPRPAELISLSFFL